MLGEVVAGNTGARPTLRNSIVYNRRRDETCHTRNTAVFLQITGGSKPLAEELSVRLAERGHDVTVYGRSNNVRHPEKSTKE